MDASVLLRNIFPPSSEVVVEFVNQVGVLEKYLSRVEDLESDYLLLQTPLVDKVPVLILEGQELTLRRLEVRSKQVYVVSVFVIENRPGKIPLLVCSKPKEINKISFRRFFRFKVDLPLVYTAGRIAFSGRVTDLSLSGCKIETEIDPRVTVGTSINLTITITQEPSLTFWGKVIRTYSLPGNSKLGAAVDFHEIAKETQDALKHFLFQCQLFQTGILGSSRVVVLMDNDPQM